MVETIEHRTKCLTPFNFISLWLEFKCRLWHLLFEIDKISVSKSFHLVSLTQLQSATLSAHHQKPALYLVNRNQLLISYWYLKINFNFSKSFIHCIWPYFWIDIQICRELKISNNIFYQSKRMETRSIKLIAYGDIGIS